MCVIHDLFVYSKIKRTTNSENKARELINDKTERKHKEKKREGNITVTALCVVTRPLNNIIYHPENDSIVKYCRRSGYQDFLDRTDYY